MLHDISDELKLLVDFIHDVLGKTKFLSKVFGVLFLLSIGHFRILLFLLLFKLLFLSLESLDFS